MTCRSAAKKGSALFLAASVLLPLMLAAHPIAARAEALTGDGHPYDAADEAARTQQPIQSNEITNWPAGPVVSAGSAILMDVGTGTVLYAKNIHERMYPASTTKLLTCLIAAENLDLNDTVTFSENAVHSVPADGSNVGMDAGQTITVEECLYGILVGSANECANAIAEKTAGSIAAFADMMNARAAELGCTDSHFTNANGLFEENHYTSAHDLSLIGKAFFRNETLVNIGCTPTYHFVATETQPDDFWIVNKHGLINGDYHYDGVLGGKTGYTSQSKETLVTGCEQNGMRLICVVMKEDFPKQFEDTISLFDYGFQNFTRTNVANNDKKYTVSSAGFLSSGADILGSSKPAFSITPASYVDVPSTMTFEGLASSISDGNVITYTLHDAPADAQDNVVVGTAQLVMNEETASSSAAKEGNGADPAAGTDSANKSDTTISSEGQESRDTAYRQKITALINRAKGLYYKQGLNGTIYLNIVSILLTIAVLALLIVMIRLIAAIARASRNSRRHKLHQRRREAKRSSHKRTRSRTRRRDDDYIDYHYDRPDHFGDDDGWY
jgi:D-alanyl-D-alanine carboxypeptidase